MISQADLNDQSVTESLQAAGRLPSVVAALFDEDDILWCGSAGAVARGRRRLDTQYRIGSITKTMTAVLVMQCRDAELLDLEDTLGTWVPESGYADATLRQLLTHTAGLQSEPAGPWWERSPGVGVADLVAANDGTGRVAPPGTFFHYSNLGYALLGEVVARARGGSWWQVLHERLLSPLGMSRTTYLPERPHAQGYSVDHFAGTLTLEPHHDTGAMAPAGQLWSTVGDLVTWGRVLTGGRHDVLTKATVDEMGRLARPDADYGLGLRIATVGSTAFRGHTGSMPGFLASLFVRSDAGDGLVVLANATTGLDTLGVVARFFEERSVDTVLAPPDKRWTPTQEVPERAASLLGLWFWGNTAVELRWHNERLELRDLATGHRTDTFMVTADGSVVGVDGYHRGETLHEHADHLECATFVYTRAPDGRWLS